MTHRSDDILHSRGALSPRGDHCLVVAIEAVPRPSGAPRWRSAEPAEGAPRFALYGRPGDWVLRADATPAGWLRLRGDRLSLEPDPGTASLSPLLRGVGRALAFEARGVPVLHATTLEMDGVAFGLLGPSGAGKSTLAAALLGRGAALLGDEILPLEERGGAIVAFGSGAQLRLWPDVGDALAPGYREWEPVVPGAAKRQGPPTPAGPDPEPVPLGALFVLSRGEQDEGAPSLGRLAPADGLVELLRAGILGDAAGLVGDEAARLGRLAGVARRIPVQRLVYPSGLPRLGAAADALIAAVRA